MEVTPHNRADILTLLGVLTIGGTLITVGGLPGLAGAALIAGLWVLLSPASLLTATTITLVAILPSELSLVALTGLSVGTVLFLSGATARPNHLPAALLGTTALTMIVAASLVGGWVWTGTLWGVALTLVIGSMLLAYTLHRYAVVITVETPA